MIRTFQLNISHYRFILINNIGWNFVNRCLHLRLHFLAALYLQKFSVQQCLEPYFWLDAYLRLAIKLKRNHKQFPEIYFLYWNVEQNLLNQQWQWTIENIGICRVIYPNQRNIQQSWSSWVWSGLLFIPKAFRIRNLQYFECVRLPWFSCRRSDLRCVEFVPIF